MLRGFDRDVWLQCQFEYDVEGICQISQAEVEVVSKLYRPAKWRDQVEQVSSRRSPPNNLRVSVVDRAKSAIRSTSSVAVV